MTVAELERDPRERFSSRVDNYVRYRPSYPAAVVKAIADRCSGAGQARVADIGCGTGIFARALLDGGFRVWGIEPNAEMRGAAERLLGECENFDSVDGSAAATTLPDGSVDVVSAAQAYHWFAGDATRAEWARILRPGGLAALVWNVRDTARSDFMREYEELLRRYGLDYVAVSHEGVGDTELEHLFGHSSYERIVCPNSQFFDLKGLVGRVESASYAPEPGHPLHAPLLAGLADLFERAESDGRVEFVYETRLFVGPLSRS